MRPKLSVLEESHFRALDHRTRNEEEEWSLYNASLYLCLHAVLGPIYSLHMVSPTWQPPDTWTSYLEGSKRELQKPGH